MDIKTSTILFTRQRHEADRAGLHYDIRLVDGDVAFSWATRKEMPEVGQSIVLHQQPVHTAKYALSEKIVIPKGNYGAGVTELTFVRKAELIKNEEAGHFIIAVPKGNRYLLKKIPSFGPKQWLFKNLGPEPEKTAASESEDTTPPLPQGAEVLDPQPKPIEDKVPEFKVIKKAEDLHSRFKPDLTTQQMERLGVLVGKYKEGDPKDPISGNYFKVDASMKQWPSKWHNDQHPLGWYEWLKGYESGKRTDDDERQIKRWLSFKARHMAQLAKADPTLVDLSIQPRRRQSLLHWAIAPGIDLEKKAVMVEMFQHDETGRKMWAPQGKPPSDRWASTGTTKSVIADTKKSNKDGSVFSNWKGTLPRKPLGYYREYTLKATSSGNRGPVRMVCGGNDTSKPEVCFYSTDHYRSFTPIDMSTYLRKEASCAESSNRYLEKIALRRVVSEFAKGTISKSLSELVRSGAIKAKEVYAKGMREGNDLIAKQIGATVQKARPGAQQVLARNGGGYVSLPNRGKGSVIIVDPKNSRLAPDKNVHQGMVRHELFEAMDANAKYPKLKNHMKNLPDVTSGMMSLGHSHRISSKIARIMDHSAQLKPVNFVKQISANKEEVVGSHLSARVLTRESEMVRKNPYLKDALSSIRHGTLESNVVKNITGKKYGVDKMTSKDHSRALGAVPDTTRFRYNNEIPTFITNKNSGNSGNSGKA